MKILVIKISALGDVILITPSLKALKEKFPQAEIYCLVGKPFAHILAACPYLDGIIEYDYKGKARGYRGAISIARQLKKQHFDISVDFQNNKKSHLIAFLAGIKQRYGYYRKFGFLLNHPEKEYRTDIAAVPHQFEILKHLGIALPKKPLLELWLDKASRTKAKALLEPIKDKKIVGISVAASSAWPSKAWPAQYIARLCDRLAEHHIATMITGTKEDITLAKIIVTESVHPPLNLVDQTSLMELAAVIEQCDVFITPDSAPLHFASAVKTPFITYFGPTDSKRHTPPFEKGIVIEKKPPCAPCYSGVCPIKTHICLEAIYPPEMEHHVLELLGMQQ